MKVIKVNAYNPVVKHNVELTYYIDYCKALDDYVVSSESDLHIHVIGRYASEVEATLAIVKHVNVRGFENAEFEVK